MAKQTKRYYYISLTLLITLLSGTFATTANAFNLSFASHSDNPICPTSTTFQTFSKCIHQQKCTTVCCPLSAVHRSNGKFNQLPAFTNLPALNYQIKTVVIDPGHGGHDKGCKGAHSQEKHIALGIAKKIGTAIRRQYPQIRVIYTRTTDKFVPLHERARIANRNQADLFISVHCNYVGVKSVQGSETYVMGLHRADDNLAVAKRENSAIYLEDNYQKNYDYDPDSPAGHIMLSMFQNAYLEQSISFAEKVEEQFTRYAGRKSRGVKQAGFLVLRETTMPSVLIEAGFLSNSREEAYLRSANGQQYMANAIFRAFINYKNEVETGSQTAPSVYNTSPVAPTTMPTEKVQVAQRQAVATPNRTANIAQPRTTTPPPDFNLPATTTRRYIATQPRSTSIPAEQLTAKSGDDFISATITNTLRGSASTTTTTSPQTTTAPIEFVVQLAASPSPINTNTNHWHNVGATVEVTQEDGYFKYQVRHFRTFAEAENVRRYLATRGFGDCFVGAYRGGQKIGIQEARLQLTN